MSSRRITAAWKVGPAPRLPAPPERWIPAVVPGAVQLDWARAEGWPPYWVGNHFRDYAWMEDVYWVYETQIPRVALGRGETLVFVCGGVDYRCVVRVGGTEVHSHEGMFTPFEVDCSERAVDGAPLQVVVFPAPKRPGAPAGRAEASASVKPAVSYGWDWHPRLIPLGLWEECGFEVRAPVRLRAAELRYELNEACDHAALAVEVAVAGEAPRSVVRWSLRGPEGGTVAEGRLAVRGGEAAGTAALAQPELWWPHDQGPQPLYLFTAELLDEDDRVVDARRQRIGFRRVRLVMHAGAWREPAVFPKSRTHPPITIEINGRTIFAKGSNWVNPEIFPGRGTAETYRPLLTLARDAHFNLLRCWGGAPVAKEAFFEQCDELGLMVWQEFPLACNLYPNDRDYLAVLERESRSIVRRLRRHPSLALWCGGNELFNAWSGMTDQAWPLRLLNRTCYEEDRTTPFLPTAPLDGMAHGDYRFRDDAGREVFQIYVANQATAYSEFGCPGPSPAEYLKTFIPAAELWPPRRGTAWETHHAFDAWEPDTWLALDVQRHYFGEPASLDELVARGEWLQCAGYQCIFEEARRQKPRCAMALNWCFNEAWPTAANNSLVNWPARPKPAYHAAAAACRPQLASARIPKFSWLSGELFRAELWLLNDRPVPFPGARVTATVICGNQRRDVLTWDAPPGPPNENLVGPELRVRLPYDAAADRFELQLTVADHSALNSSYHLHYRLVASVAEPKAQVAGARRMNT